MKDKEKKREREENQIKTIYFLATWLPWISVVVVFVTTFLTILWVLLKNSH